LRLGVFGLRGGGNNEKGVVMRRCSLLVGLVVLVAARAIAQPAQVIIIRHAEKPDEGNELSLQGEERAAALVPYFLKTDEVLKFKTPVAIYAQRPKGPTSSLRSIQTVKPLADALHLRVNDSFERDDFKNMVDDIVHKKEYEGRMVLICWEHKVIPEIALEFGVEDAPTKWPGEDFDRTWVITFKPSKRPHCKNLPQKLMYGDSDE
jgi:hypothetical protein